MPEFRHEKLVKPVRVLLDQMTTSKHVLTVFRAGHQCFEPGHMYSGPIALHPLHQIDKQLQALKNSPSPTTFPHSP